ncbi:peptidoglycan editing factor PgeF [Rheinheimera soli]|uniref:Purine nucleoside phosphorylase n=1 Tax=Rheinheimera soli TaxID=443616 RepID=A0ABU1VYB4_9GAMM|nr:peptidoglycan editing factor PgeF [Rheinheimera soli]MDR7120585.1 YfiH family protein [Rheinheimera soli]
MFHADWPAPSHVQTAVSTRAGGVSLPPYDGLNLGSHVNDMHEAVLLNRQLFRQGAKMPAEPCWLNQVHGTDCVVLEQTDFSVGPFAADASTTKIKGVVSVVLTADCLPVLFCDAAGTQVAAAHAGWRGLVDGVLEQTLAQFADPRTVMAWLGPAIGPTAFEVGNEVRLAFIQKDAKAAAAFIAVPDKTDKWLADLYQLAALRLNASGVSGVYGGGFCTYSDKERFYSYRRDGQTGRMASCIWLD